MTFKAILYSAVSALALVLAMPASAQESSRSSNAGSGDIIVTARKRQESILKVPVVETVLSSAQIERAAITNFTDLSAKVPGLSMGAAVLAIGPQISLRGVGTSTLDAGVDQSVALNLDGLALSQGLAYAAGVFDLAQAEVLKGPQALFFGKNSPGGVISLRTADPGDETEIMGRLAYETEARQKRGEIILSSPLSDTFGVRLAAMVSQQDGYFRNTATVPSNLGLGSRTPKRDRTDHADSYIVRGTAVWKPTDNFDARLKINLTNDKVDGNSSQNQLISCPEGMGPVPGFGIPFFSPSDNCQLDRNYAFVDLDPAAFPSVRNNGTPFIDTKQQFGTLELNYGGLKNVSLTSVTGYYNVDSDSMINGTQAGFSGPALYADNRFNREDFTQEFRLDTSFAGALNYTLGAFYQDSTVENIIDVGGNTALTLPATLAAGSHNMDIKVYSAFGQLRWHPVEKIELAGGVRWTNEERSDTNFLFGTQMLVPELSSDSISPELTLTYMPTDDLTLFASYKKGFKSGSYTITVPTNPASAACAVGVAAQCVGIDNSFGDEKVQGGEVGLKSRLLDRQVALNLAAYYYKYEGLQVGANEPAINGIPQVRTINAGAAKVYGIDFDVTYQPSQIEGLNLNAAVNWNYARFSELDNVPCYGGQTIAAGCNSDFSVFDGRFHSQNMNGTQLVRAPDWQISGGFDYKRPIGQNMNVSLGADAQYTSKYPAALALRSDIFQKGYTFLNANVALSGQDNKWEVALIGNNLSDEVTCGSSTALNYANGQVLGGQLTGGNDVGPAGIDEVTCVARPGRAVWLRLTYRPTGS